MKDIKLTVTVKGAHSRQRAELAVMSAFAQRKPDGFEFNIGPAAERDAKLLANGLAAIPTTLVSVGLGSVNLGKLARHMLKLKAEARKTK